VEKKKGRDLLKAKCGFPKIAAGNIGLFLNSFLSKKRVMTICEIDDILLNKSTIF